MGENLSSKRKVERLKRNSSSANFLCETHEFPAMMYKADCK